MSIEAMKQMVEALEGIHPGNMTPMAEEFWNKALHIGRQAIAKAEKQEGNVCGRCGGLVFDPVIPQPKREPLTDEQRNWIVATCPTPRHIIDAVERMHGIKGAS